MNTQPRPEDFPCEFDRLRAVMRNCVVKRPNEAHAPRYFRLHFARG